jgi:plastocyanin domain-containing protein
MLRLAAMFSFGFGSASAAEPVPPEGVDVLVQGGYHPSRVVVTQGEPARLVFLRTEWSGCTREVVFPTLGLRKELPVGEKVTIDLGTPEVGEVPFHCGMNMIHGIVVVAPKKESK